MYESWGVAVGRGHWFRGLAALLGGVLLNAACSDELPHSGDVSVDSVQQALTVGSFERRVAAGSDDVEESSSGAMSLTSTDLELVNDGTRGNQRVGLRFPGVDIPQGATITGATLAFTVDETGSTATSLSVRAQAADSAPAFTTATSNVSSRTLTSAAVAWAPSSWSTVGQAHQSPSLASLVQEVVSRPGWVSGNALAFVITGTGRRTAGAYEMDSTRAPLLHIDYEFGPDAVCGDATCDASEDCEGCVADCGECPPSTPPPVVVARDVRVVAGADDAEESSAGAVSVSSTDLELVNDGSLGNQRVGLRFRALDIPRGATITRAHVVFTTDETSSATVNLTLRGQASDDAAAFTTASSNVSSRPLTTAQITWAPAGWSSIGQAQQTPDLSPIVSEIVGRANWSPGNSLALIVTGTGRRTAEAFEGSAAQAPLLHVEYSSEPPSPPACGDATCNGDETCSSCIEDCGACPDPSLVRFAVIGDFGNNSSAEAAVAGMVTSWNPDFVVTAGDNNYENGSASTIDANVGKYYAQYIGNYTGSYGPGSPTNRFWPTLGNHDWTPGNVNPHLNYFTLPGNERYYDVDFGAVHLYAVDSDSREPDGITPTSVQGTWLQNRLQASTACWDIVVFHHAAYSSGSRHGSNVTMRWPFETWGADGVIGGHEHLYERLQVGGIPYFVNGLGGATTYSFAASPLPQSVLRYTGNRGAMLVEAQRGSIRYRFYSVDGTVRDEFTMTKSCP